MSFVLESVTKPARTNQFHSELEYLWGKLAEDVSKHKTSKVRKVMFEEYLIPFGSIRILVLVVLQFFIEFIGKVVNPFHSLSIVLQHGGFQV